MYSYDLVSPPDFQASASEYIHPAQSVLHSSRLHPSILEPMPDYLFPPVSQKSYSLLGYDGHPPHAPQTLGSKSARSFSLSSGGPSVRTPPSLSSHPYHQAKLRHRASTQQYEWSQMSFPTAPAPALTSHSVSPFDVVIGNSTTAGYNSSQSSVSTRKRVLPTSGPAPQPHIVSPNMNQNMPSLMGSTLMTPALPSPLDGVDQADIEFAQDRYGDKRCLYQCRFDLAGSPCNKWIVGDRTRVLRHLRNHHHLQTGPALPAGCRWDKCTHSRPMKQENLSRHVVMHLGVKWRCPHCKRLFSRDDAVHRHIERMVPGMDITDAEVVPGREARGLYES